MDFYIKQQLSIIRDDYSTNIRIYAFEWRDVRDAWRRYDDKLARQLDNTFSKSCGVLINKFFDVYVPGINYETTTSTIIGIVGWVDFTPHRNAVVKRTRIDHVRPEMPQIHRYTSFMAAPEQVRLRVERMLEFIRSLNTQTLNIYMLSQKLREVLRRVNALDTFMRNYPFLHGNYSAIEFERLIKQFDSLRENRDEIKSELQTLSKQRADKLFRDTFGDWSNLNREMSIVFGQNERQDDDYETYTDYLFQWAQQVPVYYGNDPANPYTQLNAYRNAVKYHYIEEHGISKRQLRAINDKKIEIYNVITSMFNPIPGRQALPIVPRVEIEERDPIYQQRVNGPKFEEDDDPEPEQPNPFDTRSFRARNGMHYSSFRNDFKDDATAMREYTKLVMRVRANEEKRKTPFFSLFIRDILDNDHITMETASGTPQFFKWKFNNLMEEKGLNPDADTQQLAIDLYTYLKHLTEYTWRESLEPVFIYDLENTSGYIVMGEGEEIHVVMPSLYLKHVLTEGLVRRTSQK